MQIKKDLQKVKKNGEIFGKFKKSPYLCIVLGEILTHSNKFQTKKTKSIMTQFIFGWVSPQVTCNFAAWAIAKEEGTIEQAEQFRLDTIEDYPNDDWFCIEKDN